MSRRLRFGIELFVSFSVIWFAIIVAQMGSEAFTPKMIAGTLLWSAICTAIVMIVNRPKS